MSRGRVCVRKEINRRLADPKEADRGSSDMAHRPGRGFDPVWLFVAFFRDGIFWEEGRCSPDAIP
jgi:hypothetical protein